MTPRSKRRASTSRILKAISGIPRSLRDLFKEKKEPPVTRNESLVRFLLIAAAFVLAAVGQVYLSRQEAGLDLGMGLTFYLGAIVFFLAAFKGRPREHLARRPLDPRVEWAVFAFVMAVAIVLRVVKLDVLPSGIFIDEGFMGYAPLRILHEGWRPLIIKDPMFIDAFPIYQMAPWYLVMPNTQWSFYLFHALMALAAFPLIYWTFRQLAGPRMALLSLFILAVMRWHINFSRNGFVSILVPLYMFGTLAFLLHGLRTRKTWPFVTAGVFLGVGVYTYNAYKAFPLLLVALGLYEFLADPDRLKRNKKRILLFAVIGCTLMLPAILVWANRDVAESRETTLFILNKCRQEGSLQPLLANVARTALMWNWRGDENPRHNLQNHRMVDDVTGLLFVLGVFYALWRLKRRKYFWSVSGLVIMSLPCLLSVDAIHANRMVGTTPFTAFLAAGAVAAVWGRAAAVAGALGEGVLLLLLSLSLMLMSFQNITVYFVKMANDCLCYKDYSIEASTIGKEIVRNKDRYEYVVTPDLYVHYTVRYFTYFQRDHVKPMDLPGSVVPAAVPPDRGLFVALERGRTGVLGWLQGLYPKGRVETVRDNCGLVLAHFFRVEPEDVAAARGLTASFSNRGAPVGAPDFPKGLPKGPYRAEFRGALVIDPSGLYRFRLGGPGRMSVLVGGRPAPEETWGNYRKGCYPIHITWDCPAGESVPRIDMKLKGAPFLPLEGALLAAFPQVRGLRGRYFHNADCHGQPDNEQMDPVINFTNGNDLPFHNVPLSARWEGTLTAPETGEYTFLCETYFGNTQDLSRVKLDGREVVPLQFNAQGTVRLAAGVPHRLEVEYLKAEGYRPTFTLKWKRPGHDVEVVPNEVFGPVE